MLCGIFRLLSALNLAKLDTHLDHTGDEPFVFSIANSKHLYFNDFLLKQFISVLDLNSTLINASLDTTGKFKILFKLPPCLQEKQG